MVTSGNFSVECPKNNLTLPDDDTGYLFCKGSDADYIVHTQQIDRQITGGDATMMADKEISEHNPHRADYGKVYSSTTVDRYGYKVLETVAKERWLGEPPSLYDWIRDGNPRLLIVENVFSANDRKYVLTVRYETDDSDNYQPVLERHKEKRQKFLDSFKLLAQK